LCVLCLKNYKRIDSSMWFIRPLVITEWNSTRSQISCARFRLRNSLRLRKYPICFFFLVDIITIILTEKMKKDGIWIFGIVWRGNYCPTLSQVVKWNRFAEYGVSDRNAFHHYARNTSFTSMSNIVPGDYRLRRGNRSRTVVFNENKKKTLFENWFIRI